MSTKILPLSSLLNVVPLIKGNSSPTSAKIPIWELDCNAILVCPSANLVIFVLNVE